MKTHDVYGNKDLLDHIERVGREFRTASKNKKPSDCLVFLSLISFKEDFKLIMVDEELSSFCHLKDFYS